VFGIPAQFCINILEKFRDENGLNQMDRYVLLKSTIKAVMNMVPTNFEDFRM
jgi:hypothetical protein